MAMRCSRIAKSTHKKCKNKAAGKSSYCASHKRRSKKSNPSKAKNPRCPRKVGSRRCKNRAAGRGKLCGVHKR